jgi:N-methylhydantoinase B/oxoprolinase/acetone carboxylase alpha subunit
MDDGSVAEMHADREGFIDTEIGLMDANRIDGSFVKVSEEAVKDQLLGPRIFTDKQIADMQAQISADTAHVDPVAAVAALDAARAEEAIRVDDANAEDVVADVVVADAPSEAVALGP